MAIKRKAFEYGSLSLEEARDRLKLVEHSKAASEVTNEIYDFGKMLVSEAVARVSRLDTKAASVAAYAIGMITLLVSTSSVWASRIQIVWLPIFVGGIAFLSAVFGVIALTLKKFEWFSDNDWLRADCMQNVNDLKSYRVLSMLVVIDSWQAVAREKSLWIKSAQFGLLVAALLLVICLLDATRVL